LVWRGKAVHLRPRSLFMAMSASRLSDSPCGAVVSMLWRAIRRLSWWGVRGVAAVGLAATSEIRGKAVRRLPKAEASFDQRASARRRLAGDQLRSYETPGMQQVFAHDCARWEGLANAFMHALLCELRVKRHLLINAGQRAALDQ